VVIYEQLTFQIQILNMEKDIVETVQHRYTKHPKAVKTINC